MRTLRRLRAQAPRTARRRDFDLTDATMEPDPGPPPEAVFDRIDRPVSAPRRGIALAGRGGRRGMTLIKSTPLRRTARDRRRAPARGAVDARSR